MPISAGNVLGLWPKFEDEYGQRDWRLQHWLRHLTYTQALAHKGIEVYTPDLSVEMDADWHYQHWQLHTQLDSALGTNQYQALDLIDVSKLENASDYSDWQSNNAYLHGTIEAALGIH